MLSNSTALLRGCRMPGWLCRGRGRERERANLGVPWGTQGCILKRCACQKPSILSTQNAWFPSFTLVFSMFFIRSLRATPTRAPTVAPAHIPARQLSKFGSNVMVSCCCFHLQHSNTLFSFHDSVLNICCSLFDVKGFVYSILGSLLCA